MVSGPGPAPGGGYPKSGDGIFSPLRTALFGSDLLLDSGHHCLYLSWPCGVLDRLCCLSLTIGEGGQLEVGDNLLVGNGGVFITDGGRLSLVAGACFVMQVPCAARKIAFLICQNISLGHFVLIYPMNKLILKKREEKERSQ